MSSLDNYDLLEKEKNKPKYRIDIYMGNGDWFKTNYFEPYIEDDRIVTSKENAINTISCLKFIPCGKLFVNVSKIVHFVLVEEEI